MSTDTLILSLQHIGVDEILLRRLRVFEKDSIQVGIESEFHKPEIKGTVMITNEGFLLDAPEKERLLLLIKQFSRIKIDYDHQNQHRSVQITGIPNLTHSLVLNFHSIRDRNTFITAVLLMKELFHGKHKKIESEENKREDKSGIPTVQSGLAMIPHEPTSFVLRSLRDHDRVFRIREMTFIGRSKSRLRRGCDFLIEDDPSISRMHASLEFKDNQIFLTVLSEQATTFVNNKQISHKETVPVPVGSLLKLGNQVFSLENKPLNSQTTAGTWTWTNKQMLPVDAEILEIKDSVLLRAIQRSESFKDVESIAKEYIREEFSLRFFRMFDDAYAEQVGPDVFDDFEDFQVQFAVKLLKLGFKLELHFHE
jgi:pSer/pThr/pTyr-binding forkhead associated (FHA) protein